ncbi:hypothetical protein HUS23_13095 [Ectothiorhodospiraceae bacterium 2226]|nr:hypothetical protein HUS23_13095 [Ectothiorhodospiraceae bacterium 2226]
MLDDTAQDVLTLVAVAGAAVFFGYCWARIFAKAGFPAWWGIWMMVPGINLIPFFYLVFGAWPAHKKRL